MWSDGMNTADISLATNGGRYARVSGLIEQAPFREGAMVHAGDLLFRIDPRPFQADLDDKKAAVAEARAMAVETKADFAVPPSSLRLK